MSEGCLRAGVLVQVCVASYGVVYIENESQPELKMFLDVLQVYMYTNPKTFKGYNKENKFYWLGLCYETYFYDKIYIYTGEDAKGLIY